MHLETGYSSNEPYGGAPDQHLPPGLPSHVALDGQCRDQPVPMMLPVTTMDNRRVEGNTDLVLWLRGVAKAVLRNVEFYEHRKEEAVRHHQRQPPLHLAGHG
jgi:hypothetical protein